MSQRRLAFEPASRQALRRGFNLLANAMEVTLGPHGRRVAVARENPRRAPEMLDDGAQIARRFMGVANRFESMGAFLARHMAWKVEEAVGDGSTTAVAIARYIINESDRYVAAGHNPMRIRLGLEKALPVALAALAAQARPLDDPAQIAALAQSITGDSVLGNYVEEAFDVVGAYGAVSVRTNYARTHDRRYINGAFWNQGWVSSNFVTEGSAAILQNPYILLTNHLLESASDLAPIMELVHKAGDRGLVVIANNISGGALNILVANKARKKLPTLAIKAPGFGSEKTDILEDLAALCGAKVLLRETGAQLAHARLADLGQAEEVHAIRSGFTMVGGKGRPAAIRTRSQELRSQLAQAKYGRERERLMERIGKLIGGVALVEVGAATETERDFLKDRAKEAVHVVRQGLMDGVAAGGGVAYLACLPALAELELSGDEAVAVPILCRGLAAPAEAILRNSGLDPTVILAQLSEGATGCGYDVVAGRYVDMMEAHIVDPVRVLQTALQIGVSGASMAITTDVLVHRPRQNRDEDVDFNP